jgi:hypothetical protein
VTDLFMILIILYALQKQEVPRSSGKDFVSGSFGEDPFVA